MQLPPVPRSNLTRPGATATAWSTFIFIRLPLYFRFNFSLFVAELANGDASGHRGKTLHGIDRNAEATGRAFLFLPVNGAPTKSSTKLQFFFPMPIKLIILSAPFLFHLLFFRRSQRRVLPPSQEES